MRVVVVVSLLALLSPVAALAQAPAASAPAPASPPAVTAPAPAATPPAHPAAAPRRGGDITRDEYIERAKAAAERRFDAMDADHDGVLTAEERRAYREAHRRGGGATPAASEPEPQPQPAKSQ